jgi:hypothetical protein
VPKGTRRSDFGSGALDLDRLAGAQAARVQQALDMLTGPGLAAEPDERVSGDQIGVGCFGGIGGGDDDERFAGDLVQHQPLRGNVGAGDDCDVEFGPAHRLRQFR